MKNILNLLIFPIIVGITIIIFQVSLSKEAEIKFSLSAKLEYNDSDSSSLGDKTNIQQIIVKNTGDKEAKNLTIKIKGVSVSLKDIYRDFQSDSFKVVKATDSSNFELSYNRLLPSSSFNLILNTRGDEIVKDNIKIFHTEGEGEAIQDNTDINNIISYSSAFFSIIYLLLSTYSFKTSLVNSLKGDSLSKYRSEDILDRKSKPLYLFSDKKWKEIREQALETFFDFEPISYLNKIKDSKAYIWLNKDKPVSFSEDEWQKALKILKSSFDRHISGKVMHYITSDNLNEIFELEKPKNLPQESWDKIQVIISRAYFYFLSQKKQDYSSYSELKSIQKEIEEGKNNLFTEEDWKVYLYFLKSLYLKGWIKEVIRNSYNYTRKELLEKVFLESLEDEKKLIEEFKDDWKNTQSTLEILEQITKSEFKNEKPTSLDENKWMRLKSFASQWEETQTTWKILEQITKSEFKNEKPNSIDTIRWINLQILAKNFDEVKDIEEKTRKLELMSIEIPHLKDKITSQLEIIDKLLSNPDALDFIEDYNNTFSDGNFENLKKVAEILKKEKE